MTDAPRPANSRPKRGPPDAARVVIGLAGLGGGGKGEAKVLILAHRSGTTIHLRTIVEEELAKQGRPVTNHSLREEATRLRELEGPAALARRAAPKVLEALDRFPTVVIDSIKSAEETTVFRATVPGRFIVLAVIARPELRFHRLAARGLPWDMSDRASFDWRDQVESGWGTDDAVAQADYTIVNEGTRDELAEKVRGFLDWLDRSA
jgi:dephospho-CoA kinase